MAIDTVERALAEGDGNRGRRGPSLRWRMVDKLAAIVSLLLPGLAVGRPCPLCGGSMEMTSDHPVAQSTPLVVEGLRFWECLECGLTSVQSYMYVQDTESWR